MELIQDVGGNEGLVDRGGTDEVVEGFILGRSSQVEAEKAGREGISFVQLSSIKRQLVLYDIAFRSTTHISSCDHRNM